MADPAARKRAVNRSACAAADYFGNTPAVCRRSYIHLRLPDVYDDDVAVADELAELGADSGADDFAHRGRGESAIPVDPGAVPRRAARSTPLESFQGDGSVSAADLTDLVDLLSRRHVLAMVDFLRGGPQPFGSLVAHLSANPAQVTQRARELREAGLIEVDEGGDYRLSGTGRRLLGTLDGLERFASDWAVLSPRQRIPRGSATRGRGEPSDD